MQCGKFDCHQPATHALVVIPGAVIRTGSAEHGLAAFARCHRCGDVDVQFQLASRGDYGADSFLVPLPKRLVSLPAEAPA